MEGDWGAVVVTVIVGKERGQFDRVMAVSRDPGRGLADVGG